MNRVGDTKGPMQFIYYMSILEDSPCKICLVQPLCEKSFMDDSACNEFSKFISEKVKEIEHENKG